METKKTNYDLKEKQSDPTINPYKELAEPGVFGNDMISRLLAAILINWSEVE